MMAAIELLESRTLLTTVIGLISANQLVVFDSATPQVIAAHVAVSMPKGETLLGIDFDNASQLYGLSDAHRIYRIDPETGIVTATADSVIPASSGDRLVFDINPGNPDTQFRAVGRSRRQFSGPFRKPVEASAVAYTADDVNAGQSPNLVALGLTSGGPFASETAYALDATTDSLVTIGTLGGRRSPDGGRLYTVGRLGIDVASISGLDITNGGLFRFAFASTATKRGTLFFSIDLSTGPAQSIGLIGGGSLSVRDIAVVPTVGTTILGVTSGNELLAFDSSRPSVILARTAITGMRSDESMLSIDFRPGAAELFGVSSRDVLYQIDPTTGGVRQVGSRFTPFFKGAPVSADFDPISGALAVVSDRGEVLHLNPDSGAVIDSRPFTRGIQIDPPLHYAPGDSNAAATPHVLTIAHANNFVGAPGSTLFALDPVTENIVTVSGSGNGALTTGANVGGLIDDIASLDIITLDGDAAFIAVRSPHSRPVTFYTIDLASGSRRHGGDIASGRKPVRDIAATG